MNHRLLLAFVLSTSAHMHGIEEKTVEIKDEATITLPFARHHNVVVYNSLPSRYGKVRISATENSDSNMTIQCTKISAHADDVNDIQVICYGYPEIYVIDIKAVVEDCKAYAEYDIQVPAKVRLRVFGDVYDMRDDGAKHIEVTIL